MPSAQAEMGESGQGRVLGAPPARGQPHQRNCRPRPRRLTQTTEQGEAQIFRCRGPVGLLSERPGLDTGLWVVRRWGDEAGAWLSLREVGTQQRLEDCPLGKTPSLSLDSHTYLLTTVLGGYSVHGSRPDTLSKGKQ